MLNIVAANGSEERAVIAAMRARAAQVGADIDTAVQAIMNTIKEEGFPAVARYSRQFDR